jgi:hypothetical protein
MDNRNDVERLAERNLFPIDDSALSYLKQPDLSALGICGQAIQSENVFGQAAQAMLEEHQHAWKQMREILESPIQRMLKEQVGLSGATQTCAQMAKDFCSPAMTAEPPQPAWKSMVEKTLRDLTSFDGIRQAIENLTRPAIEAAELCAHLQPAAYFQETEASVLARQVVDDLMNQSRQVAESIMGPLRQQQEQWLSSITHDLDSALGVQPIFDHAAHLADWKKSLGLAFDPNEFLTSALDFLDTVDSTTLREWTDDAAAEVEIRNSSTVEVSEESGTDPHQKAILKALLLRCLRAFLPTKDAKEFHPLLRIFFQLLIVIVGSEISAQHTATNTNTIVEHHETIVNHQETIIQAPSQSLGTVPRALADAPSEIVFRPVLKPKQADALLFAGFGGAGGVVTRLKSSQWLRVFARQGEWIEVFALQTDSKAKALSGWIKESDTVLVPPEELRSFECGLVENDRRCD